MQSKPGPRDTDLHMRAACKDDQRPAQCRSFGVRDDRKRRLQRKSSERPY